MSIKKLQDLLNPSLPSNKESAKLGASNRQSPPTVHKSFSPLANTLPNNISGSPKYVEIPGHKNLFYHPFMKNQDEVCPSPAITKQPVKENLSAFHSSRNTAPDTNENNSKPENPELSGSISSLLNMLNSQNTNQPKTLQQLLQQTSFSSMPSQSMFQSPFTSSMPSPFFGNSNTQSSHFTNSNLSDFSNILTASILGTPAQNNVVFSQQQTLPMTQPNNLIDNALAFQVTELLKQENEKKIQAITELLKSALQQQNLNQMPNMNNIQTLTNLENMIKVEETNQNKSPIALSNGLTMNPIKRITPPTNTVDPRLAQKIENTRKELFMMGTGKKKEDIMAEENPTLSPNPGNISLTNNNNVSLLDLLHGRSNNNNKSSPTPSYLLNQQMANMSMKDTNKIDLTPLSDINNVSIKTETEADWTMLEKSEDFANFAIHRKMNKDKKAPGVYTRDERLGRILKYKNKIKKWRIAHPVNRAFKGRSSVAGKKPRIKGKFVKLEEYVKHVTVQKKNPNNSNAGNESSYFTEGVTEVSGYYPDTFIKEEGN